MLVTGFIRSGTTLLEKRLHSHPQICIASQPLPSLYLRIKKAFLREIGSLQDPYPLGNLFKETRYNRRQFTQFLNQFTLSKSDIQTVCESMRNYSGQRAPELLDAPKIDGTLSEQFLYFNDFYSELVGKPGAIFCGAKEVFCEEFIDYFLAHDISITLIIRSPLEVVRSIRFDHSSKYVNSLMSLVHIIRSWRKSVAYAIQYANHTRFNFVLYEDLVHQPLDTLNGVTKNLGLESFSNESITHPILDQSGKLWQGNSSFKRPNAFVQEQCDELSEHLIKFVSATCAPEMNWLGIGKANGIDHSSDWLVRTGLQLGLSKNECEEENLRLEMLSKNTKPSKSQEELECWFVHKSAFDAIVSYDTH